MELDLSKSAIAALKSEAKSLRLDRNWNGEPTTHAEALERVAQRRGARDWNTLHAQAKKPVRLAPGMRVSGRYLNQPFTGEVHGLQRLAQSGRLQVTLRFDAPVDVVVFDSFSAFRSQVTAVIDAEGRAVRHTSDGVPHLILDTAGL